MTPRTTRKPPRFFVVNAAKDRRLEFRFECRHPVLVVLENIPPHRPATAYDIGSHGLRLETDVPMDTGRQIQIAFPESRDGVVCFGRIAWSRRHEEGLFESGVALREWHGILEGAESWKIFKGIKPKRDRRQSPRR